MVRMWIVPMGGEDHFGPVPAQQPHDGDPVLLADGEMTIRQPDVHAGVQAHDPRGIQSFLGADLRRPPGPHLTARHVRDAGAVSERLELEQGAGHGQFRIVRMREDGEHVELRVIGHEIVSSFEFRVSSFEFRVLSFGLNERSSYCLLLPPICLISTVPSPTVKFKVAPPIPALARTLVGPMLSGERG